MNIIIISAVRAETALLIDELRLKEESKILFADNFSGIFRGNKLNLINSGAGSVNTAGALGAAVTLLKPDLIIQTGICGAFKKSGLDLCDIAIAESETDIQLGLESEILIDDLPFDIFKKNNISIKNRIDINASFVDEAYKILKDRFKTAKGDFISASTITTSDERALLIENNFYPLVESMEGFSAALVSKMCGIKFIEIRSVSNFVGKRDRENWKVTNACFECSNATLHYLNNLNQ